MDDTTNIPIEQTFSTSDFGAMTVAFTNKRAARDYMFPSLKYVETFYMYHRLMFAPSVWFGDEGANKHISILFTGRKGRDFKHTKGTWFEMKRITAPKGTWLFSARHVKLITKPNGKHTAKSIRSVTTVPNPKLVQLA